ncbi:23S rRNA (cytosine1962-C5)-methyltransferase [Oceanisphaera litoralis]|uniref:class I SAM-dependent methyltransferase n=1 Tax=Oceanisphaera litoralis TaxID=225144 RepID=UPI001EF84229|nr:class I SAM-dependent methyltransferase [Oceanisphaera litoralis]MBM7454690.1 23S rRNA (cytosine1962-C5)-methyltransferase [Oceanisphaera litoralis]
MTPLFRLPENLMDVSALPVFYHQLHQALDLGLKEHPDDIRRLFHGRGRRWPGLEQLTADWLDGQLLVSLFREPEPAFLAGLNALLQTLTEQDIWQQSGARALLLQHRSREGAPVEVLWGTLEPRPQVREQGLRYQLELGRNQNHGLFLDMRLGRRWVQQQAQGKRVLNLFAYTCGFSVAALEGGAELVVNLDMARAALSRGRDNHRLNHHDLSKVTFLGHELFKSWGKVRKLGPYDLIIIDPPSFQKGSFALTQDYHKILRRLPELLTASGQVLACVNDPDIPSRFLIDNMAEQAPALRFVERLDNPPEFEDTDPEAGLKALVFGR